MLEVLRESQIILSARKHSTVPTLARTSSSIGLIPLIDRTDEMKVDMDDLIGFNVLDRAEFSNFRFRCDSEDNGCI